MEKLGEIRKKLLDDLKEFYKELKRKSGDYGRLEEKIRIAIMQEKWNDPTYGNFVEERLIQFYEEDVRSLPISTQATDESN